MVSIQEMLIGNGKEETEEKIDIENDSSYLTACWGLQFITKWSGQGVTFSLLLANIYIDPADAAVAVQRRTTLRRLVHFIMTFISYGSSQEIHISGSGEPGIYTQNKTMIW